MRDATCGGCGKPYMTAAGHGCGDTIAVRDLREQLVMKGETAVDFATDVGDFLVTLETAVKREGLDTDPDTQRYMKRIKDNSFRLLGHAMLRKGRGAKATP